VVVIMAMALRSAMQETKSGVRIDVVVHADLLLMLVPGLQTLNMATIRPQIVFTFY
jgi:hypothetical protein